MLAKTLHLGGFVASMLAVGAWLRSVDTIPFWSWTQGKAAHVAKGGVDCDTLFLGSSRMHYGIAPAEFDAQMAQLGLPSKSWNLAFCGVRQHDQAAILDWLLAERPAGLKRVVVELHGFDQRLRGGKWLTDMQVEMHTPGQFLGRCSSILASGDGLWNKLEQFAFVTAHTAVNAMRVGQGCRILLDPLDQSRPAGLSRAEAADRGWRPNGDATHHSDNEVQAHAAFLAHPERAARVAQEKAVDPARSFLAGGFNHRAFAAQVEAARSAGIEILFVVMPTLTHDFQGRDGVDEASQRARILEMDRFAEHPLLGDPSLYYDASHLNEKGARVFSRALARAIARPQASRSSQALTLEVEATGPGKAAVHVGQAPAHGEVWLGISGQRATTSLGNGHSLGIKLPPLLTLCLQREVDGSATGMLDWPQDMRVDGLHMQACVLHEGRAVAVSPVLTLGADSDTAHSVKGAKRLPSSPGR